MIAYVDASVLLRIVFQQAGALREWTQLRQGVASALVTVECLRSLDRLRLRARLSDEDIAGYRHTVLALIGALELVELDAVVLDRAAQPMPTELGSLDAIHLATALSWKEMTGASLVMATHDQALALAARAHGLPVIGTGA